MNRFENYVSLINDNLTAYLPPKNNLQKSIVDAMEYSLTIGGKRIRPILILEFCRVCGGDINKALPFACAVEMVHTYSLIHDDLPCMDNDDLRRGHPTSHIVYGEAIALLAGDALLTRAFEIILSDDTVNMVGKDATLKAAACLSQSIGVLGMVGGQVIDIESENKNKNKNISEDILNEMHCLKTGALIVAAAKIGCILAGANENQMNAAASYAANIGLAFQIVDDILDATSTAEKLGKNVGQDKFENKSTYVSIFGIEKSKQFVDVLTDNAISDLDVFDFNKDFLKDLALSLANRDR